ncbi:MAG: di-trans,poly-cis-decaprenylcistransferase [Chloroflexi bacterium]|nr:di-trans,poly-cis-decaprenylcistransferase [Chloroflexota bacterium]
MTATRPDQEQAASEPALADAAPIHPLPRHVAIIMDGNGRWARARNLPRQAGHRAGTENIRRIIEGFAEHGVEMITLYAFSTENWSRPPEEVDFLLNLIPEVLERETAKLHEKGARLRHLGRLDVLAPDIQRAVRDAIELTKNNTRITVNLAFNYGGRAEIVDAIRALLAEGVPAEAVTEEVVSAHLYTAGAPDPDLIIRTAGEMRLSNFLIWQAAYAEYYSTPVYWPDFGKDDVRAALLAYSRRKRRFGGLDPH